MFIITKKTLKNFLKSSQKIAKHIFLFVFLFQSHLFFGQFKNTDSSPASIKWFIKKSENFKVYFPQNLDSIANYTINSLEGIVDKTKIYPDFKIRKSKIILHNYNSIPNGFVASFPRRSELYINAKPELSHFLHNNNWISLLAMHEYRHFVQREIAFNKPFHKMAYWLFGDLVFSTLSRASLPNWYWEGDAVDVETRNSNYGRGRVPFFYLNSKNNLLDGRKIKYDRQVLGSYKMKTPNEYESGYLMVKYLKDTFGIKTFNKIINKTQSYSFVPLTFIRTLKKETGLNYKTLYSKSLETIRPKTNKNPKPLKAINIRKKNNYESYYYPTETEDGSVLFLKKGLGSYQYFGLIDTLGNIKKVFTPGLVNNYGRISYAANHLVWLEFDKDPRWNKRVYSVIKVFDLKRKKIISKSKKTFYASVDISNKGDSLVALNNNLDGSQSLFFLNTKNCIPTKEIKLKKGVYSNVRFTKENKIIGIKTKDGVKTIFIYSLKDNEFKEILNTNKNIGSPSKHDSLLVFSSGESEKDDVLIYNLINKKSFKLKSNSLGNYFPSFSQNGEFLFFNSMTKNGFDVFKLKTNNNMKEIKNISSELQPNFKEKKQKNYKSTRIYKPLSFINPVTWGITDFNNSLKGLDDVSFGFESRDIFGSFLFRGGYKYNVREKEGERYFGLSYQGLYPIFYGDISLGNKSYNRNLILTRSTGEMDTIYDADINYKVKEFTIGTKIPLSFTKGKYFSNFISSVEYSNQKFYDFYTKALSSSSGQFPLNTPEKNTRVFLNSFVYYSRVHKKTKRQVYYPWGQTILFEIKKTTSSSDFYGDYFRTDVYLDFPGINILHSLRTKFRYEYQDIGEYTFREKINFIYGYKNNGVFKDFVGWGIEYELPFLYPDFSIGPIINFQRLRYTAFINGGVVNGKNNIFPYTSFKDTPISFGGELAVDFNLFRQNGLFDIGLRWSYLTNTETSRKNPIIEVLLGIIAF
tara:strand:- start:41 stop:2965 length:2925 start_codon:yes stop_codon:yes gene_type:complete